MVRRVQEARWSAMTALEPVAFYLSTSAGPRLVWRGSGRASIIWVESDQPVRLAAPVDVEWERFGQGHIDVSDAAFAAVGLHIWPHADVCWMVWGETFLRVQEFSDDGTVVRVHVSQGVNTPAAKATRELVLDHDGEPIELCIVEPSPPAATLEWWDERRVLATDQLLRNFPELA